MADEFATCCNRARAHARRGRFAEAAAAYREALLRRPDDVKTRLDLVLVLRRQRHVEDAETEARAALAAAPASVAACEALAGVLFEQGRAAEAADAFRAVLRVRPEHARVRLSLAWALEQLQDWTGAEAAAREALARKSDDPLAQETLARVLRR